MMASEPLKVGVVGVTGAVGQEIIEVLGNRGFPVSELKLFASARSAGKPGASSSASSASSAVAVVVRRMLDRFEKWRVRKKQVLCSGVA